MGMGLGLGTDLQTEMDWRLGMGKELTTVGS